MSLRIIYAGGVTAATNWMNEFPAAIRAALPLAINDGARYGLKIGRDQILKEINFPAGYVNDQRFFIKDFAQEGHNEASIAGRGRATSLVRFASGDIQIGGGRRIKHIQLRVGPDKISVAHRLFTVRLKAGRSLTEDNYNVGIAIRLRPGETIKGKYKLDYTQLAHNVYLLYGPSVAQAFGTVSGKVAPKVIEFVETEFFRQFNVRLGKGLR